MASSPPPLKHLAPGWFSLPMGLAGLSLAWWRAGPLMGDTATGIALGLVLWWLAVATLGPWLQSRHGLALTLSWPSAAEWSLLGGVFAAGLLASLLPGWRAYRLSLADGLSPKGL